MNDDAKEAKLAPRAMGVGELTATPVTLGVVLVLWSLIGTGLAYVLGHLEEIQQDLSQLARDQEKLGGKIESIAAAVSASKELFSVRMALQPPPAPEDPGTSRAKAGAATGLAPLKVQHVAP